MLDILYQNDEIVVVDKPAGLASQPGEAVGASVITLAEAELGFRPYPVHRLDKETAGCMILAKNKEAASRWSDLIATRTIRKVYWAVCSGEPETAVGHFDDVLKVNGRPLEAHTKYRRLAAYSFPISFPISFTGATGTLSAINVSLLELELGTGRMHQIRRHLAMHGLPILGDDKYGDFALNRVLHKKKNLKHLLLWARELKLYDGTVIQSKMPEHFSLFLRDWPDWSRIEAWSCDGT
ncbi:MAG TPA: RNA pseudouridine synthase [Spirochaetales bacterium]|nr:RNA pseudouridine synthase [Spirochaetales bacterium]